MAGKLDIDLPNCLRSFVYAIAASNGLWLVASVHVCQVSEGGLEACPGDVVIDVVVEGA